MKELCILLVIACTTSCSVSEKPKKFLKKEEMIELLYEVTLHQSIVKYDYSKDTVVFNQTQNELFNKHGLDSLSFINLQRYYLSEKEIYQEICDSIAIRLNKKIDALKHQKMPINKRPINKISVQTKKDLVK